MKKTVIVYASTHHGNTRTLVKAIAEKYHVDLIDATSCYQAELSGYEQIGFASGIDFGKFYTCVEQFLKDNLPEGKPVFFLYTCAQKSERFTRTVREAAGKKSAILLGEYGCRGYNTYGPWKLVGGMNRGHPNPKEIGEAMAFFESLDKDFR